MGTGKEIIYSRVCLLILSCNSEVQENNTDIQKAKRTQKTHTVLGTVWWFVLLFFWGGVVMVVLSVFSSFLNGFKEFNLVPDQVK